MPLIQDKSNNESSKDEGIKINMEKNNNKQKDLTLEMKDLVVEYHTDEEIIHALNGLELFIERGKTLGLVGETGAGKTTAALSIMQLIASPPGVIKKGSIFLNKENILQKSKAEMGKIRGKDVSMIFQDPMTALNPVITIEKQIAEVINHHSGCGEKKAILEAGKMMELVGIPSNRGVEYPHQFSGGMRQRVVIAMALACNPKLLIADEPTTALDVTIQAQVLEMMKNLKESYGTSMLMITHDLGIVAETCDTVSIIYAGRIVEHGTLEDIFEKTLHPYTEGLFNSLPNMEKRDVPLKPIKGLMSDPANLPSGCSFCPRCNYAKEICNTEKPKRIYSNETHFVECHLYNGNNIADGTVINQ